MRTALRTIACSCTATYRRFLLAAGIALTLLLHAPLGAIGQAASTVSQGSSFGIEEATIGDVHQAIQSGAVSCVSVVQAYIDRAKAYNGVCTQLVTKDGAPIAPGPGTTRAGSPLVFPTATVPISTVLPDVDQYKGLPFDFGRMEATSSDPTVQQQFGMVVGIENAGQVNALSTLNLRGERSVTCKAGCDAPVSAGPLPKNCSARCEAFRRQPDALEQAAQLDAKYGSKPDLSNLPMYCIPFSFKDGLDTTDMRSTGGGDVNYAMDAAPRDSTIVAQLRAKGAIIYAKANLAEYNAGSGDPGGSAVARSDGYGVTSRSTWAGVACNPYDTTRETGGSSSGSAAGVAANLVMCSICEETGGSCRQPAWRNGIVGMVTTKGLIPYGGAIGADPYLDRAGIHCRTVTDTALVLDAIKDSKHGYFDSRDIHTALPKVFSQKEPYAQSLVQSGSTSNNKVKALAGMRLGVVREYMVKHGSNDAAMSDHVNNEIKRVLRDQLGAELVESFDPLYANDPSIPDMTYHFQHALAEILPLHMPEYLHRRNADGTLTFAVPGHDVTTRDYMVNVAVGKAPLSPNLNLRSVTSLPRTASFSFHIAHYLLRRGDDRVTDWASLNANAKYGDESRRVAMKNWENKVDITSDVMTQQVQLRDVMRLVLMKVMHENRLDALVNPTITLPPARIGYASQPTVRNRPTGRFPSSGILGIPEITVPGGFNRANFEPEFALNAAKDGYRSIANESRRSTLESPLPVGISFWAGPGDESTLFKIASAYEAATKHRVPPSTFGSVRPQSR
jgi:amidase